MNTIIARVDPASCGPCMSGKRLGRVKSLPGEVVAKLRDHGILTCKDFLTRHPLELMDVLRLSHPQLLALTATVSRDVAPRSQNVLSLYKLRQQNPKTFLPTSLHKLDTALHGGLPAGTITEVAGPAGCGKTQFCLTLAVVASLPPSLGGLGVHVAYIDTEAAFTAERLVEIAKSRYREHFSSVEQLVRLTESVHVFPALTCKDLDQHLEAFESVIAAKAIGLVIVDSIASLVRKEFDTRSGRGVTERTALLTRQATRLKFLAESFDIPVVVTNQITTHLSHDLDGSVEGGSAVVTAALGNTWSHYVNTRLILEYLDGQRRILSVAKSPLCDSTRFVASIEQRGVVLDWAATVDLEGVQEGGDPTSISIAVRSSAEDGLRVLFPGQYPTISYTTRQDKLV